MKKPYLLLMLIVLFSCSDGSEEEAPIEPTTSDIGVSFDESSISWMNPDDLSQKLTSALRSDYGDSRESETDKELIINNDTTLATATIGFKTAYQNKYFDPDPTNNSATIELIKNLGNTDPTSVELKADGPGNTYELITSVLAPGYSPIEVPDCSHPSFGDHIDELFDNDLNTNVFRFHIHVDPDNDRCINFDRQRNEIKTYDKSPENLKGIKNEKVIYNWKFKLSAGFKSSPNFTHIHQLKSVGGSLASMPMYTLTTRKGNPDQLELRYAETDSQITLKKTDLAPFVNTWLEVTETISYADLGTYEIAIKKVSDGTVLFEYSNASIVNWRPAASFVRPTWGIYRSLLNQQDLRDEEVLFADFSITEVEE